MQSDDAKASLAIAIATLAVIALLCHPALILTVKRALGKRSSFFQYSDLYEDEDGVATEESQAAYSDFIQRVTLVSLSIIGSLAALALAVITTINGAKTTTVLVGQWLQFAVWTPVVLQTVIIFITPSSISRYRLGILSALSGLVIVISLAAEAFLLKPVEDLRTNRGLYISLVLLAWIPAVVLAVTSVLIPRRPDVFHNGRLVDRENTSTLLSKLTFSWSSYVLDYAVKNKGLDYDDLPEPAYEARAHALRENFESAGKQSGLWKSIFWSRKAYFILQWILEAISSFLGFLPQVSLYYLLRTLEARDAGHKDAITAWLLIAALGLSVIICSWIDNLMFFTSFVRIGVPIYEQLSAVIFGKAIRRKDIKGIGKSDPTLSNGAAQYGEELSRAEENEEDLQKTRQSTINLVGVDSMRISEFVKFNYLYVGAFIKIIIAIVFLVRLIGWVPMLAGLATPLLITPLNIYLSKKYAARQDDLMKYRDQKTAVIAEALQGIRQIKFSALEQGWYEKILEVRRKELKTQWAVFVYDSFLIAIWIFGPVMLPAISLSVYAVVNKRLSASVAFTTISLFDSIEVILAVIPGLVTDMIDAIVSANRIQAFLDSPEKDNKNLKPGQRVAFKDATIAWPSDEHSGDEHSFKLRNINLEFPNGELSVISGRTGSGKSLLLSSIIGEAEVIEGTVSVPEAPIEAERYDSQATPRDWIIPSSIAYVAQIPWIENASIRDNILFGLPMDHSRYSKVLSVCALEKDLEMLEDGELTDIGANGINLSGGQKWRISFARALYSRAGILVLDDIFSAVDANVGRQLFEQALTGVLGRGRTRILVTHHVALCLPETSYSVLLTNGEVEEAGPTEQLRRTGKLKSILATDVEEQKKEEEEAGKLESAIIDDCGTLHKTATNQSFRSRRLSTISIQSGNLRRQRSRANLDEELDQPQVRPKKFNQEEARETGAVKWSVYAQYIQAGRGFGYWTFIMLVFGFWVVVYLTKAYWISMWARSYESEKAVGIRLFQQHGSLAHHIQTQFRAVEIDPHLARYLGVYLGLSLLAWFVGAIRYFLIWFASIRASRVMFENMAYAVLRAPLRWVDTTPTGRILNRFTADFNMVDSRIAINVAFTLHNVIHVVSILIAGAFVSPLVIVLAVLLLAVSVYYVRRYLAGAREVKRLESTAKSPVFEQFGSVLTGIATIRAFDKPSAYIDRMYERIDTHCKSYMHIFLFNRWMNLRLSLVGTFFVIITGALIVSTPSIDAPLAGFALSFALGLSESVIYMVRDYSNVELNSNATERILEYSHITIEKQDGEDVPAAWPTQGEVEVKDLVVGYAPDLPPVLKGLTFRVAQSQRIGVVGRTGAGKSSLTLAIFRFLEATSGSIHIDGVDISKIKLYDLRSRLAIIPQDPVLFSGTLRSNLDPFNQHSDSELREALARVHLVPSSTEASGVATPVGVESSTSEDLNGVATNKNIFRSLNSKISEGGLNLSQGQRQLLCLARAIVSRPKVMVLDEATSAVDMETDALIQRSIREEFQGSTLIVIAHRLSTIADFDKILVMGEGKVVEYDEPARLMEDSAVGVFKSLVQESGERKELEGIIQGRSGHRHRT